MAKGDFLFVIEKVADFTVGNDMLFSKGNNLHVCNRWKVVGVTGLCLQVGLCSTYWSPKEGYSMIRPNNILHLPSSEFFNAIGTTFIKASLWRRDDYNHHG